MNHSTLDAGPAPLSVGAHVLGMSRAVSPVERAGRVAGQGRGRGEQVDGSSRREQRTAAIKCSLPAHGPVPCCRARRRPCGPAGHCAAVLRLP
ncbi:hypothetical protein E2562_032760 [Oryza meyeriana var. granulata]|uniref:Uncharacterized protein n=1 Tax=Oryza meyeriana var. granulata TaxID=110450 RepID=A0A6G1E5L9_9ORYZ|nr:hypothetical protein E2562_032760 [Oryza meyeriana var. granulata]